MTLSPARHARPAEDEPRPGRSTPAEAPRRSRRRRHTRAAPATPAHADNEQDQPEQAWLDPAQPEQAWLDPAQPEPDQPEPDQPEPAGLESVRREPAQREPGLRRESLLALHEPLVDEPPRARRDSLLDLQEPPLSKGAAAPRHAATPAPVPEPEIRRTPGRRPEISRVQEPEPEVSRVLERTPESRQVFEPQPEVSRVLERTPESRQVFEPEPEVSRVFERESEISPVPEPAPESRRTPAPVAELVDRLPADEVVDAADVVGEMAALGIDDATARERYGMSLHGVGVAVLAQLRERRTPKGVRRAPTSRPYLLAAAQRCALYLGPLGVAVAAARLLGQVGWLVPVAVLVLGWSTAQAMTSLGLSVARTAGVAAASRLVAGGFAAALGLWCAAVWVAPGGWLGADRMLALVIGVGGLTALATVTAAMVTRAEVKVIIWSAPCWLLGAATVAAGPLLPEPLLPQSTRVLVETLLPAAIVVAAVRAFRPLIGCPVPRRRALAKGEVRRAVGYLIAGAAQTVAVALIWRAGDPAVTAAAAIPLLLAVPALETLVGWHLHQIESGMDAADTERDYRRHVRRVAVATVSALLPPLVAGIALAAVAYRLPDGLIARDGVLALAAGTLLGGLFAATFLIAARGRTTTAATVAAVAPLAIVTLPWLTPLAPLPTVVAVMAGTLLLGLLTVAHIAADHRRPL